MISISLAHADDKREIKTKLLLEKILSEYNLSDLIYTEEIIIDRESIPHSHPVLTLHTRHGKQKFLLLSTFIHEQIHWYLSSKLDKTKDAIEQFKILYPEVPVGFPEGSPNEYGTYLHLVVNYLEYEVLKTLVGQEKAKEIIVFWSDDHYTWIYQQVLDNYDEIKRVVENHDLEWDKK